MASVFAGQGITGLSTSRGLAVRDSLRDNVTEFLEAIAGDSSVGILLTDPDLQVGACNAAMGSILRTPTSELVESTLAAIAKRVSGRPPDSASLSVLVAQVAGYPDQVVDADVSIALGKGSRRTYRVVSRPGERGTWRTWTFRDVARERRILRMHELLGENGGLFDPDPRSVYREIMRRVSDFYEGSTVMISIRQGDYLRFKAVEGPASPLKVFRGNAVNESYCQFALSTVRPLLVQDARLNLTYAKLSPSRMGYTRYLGVPLRDDAGLPVGTLCILDRKSDDPLNEDDIQFMSLIGARINVELSREHWIAERIAAKDAVLQRQEQERITTQSVLVAMNAGFAMLGEPLPTDDVVRRQTSLLRGLLGYESVALILGSHGAAKGMCLASKKNRPSAISLRTEGDSWLAGVIRRRHQSGILGNRSTAPIANLLDSDHVIGFCLPSGGAVILGSEERAPIADRGHSILLEALIDQVRLLLTSHMLQREVIEANERIRFAQDQLVKSEKLSVVGTLAAGTAHDIRNIVAALIVLTSPGLQTPEEALTAVREQLDRFNVLALRLMSYAKPEGIRLGPVDLCEVLERVLGLTAGQIRIAGTDLRWTPSPAQVHGDQHQLEHLFVNLVLNAVQSMEPDGGVLRVSVECRDEHAIVEVADTGAGIAAGAAARLFEPFASSKLDGFGLGLYSCRRIVEQHSGEILVKRNRPRGTIFQVSLRTVVVPR